MCVAYGWPAPEVEWQKDEQTLPSGSGVVSESSSVMATVSAKLIWTRRLLDSDTGIYKCVLRRPNTTVSLEYQGVRLKAVNLTQTESSSFSCETRSSSLIYFQIRVFATDCDSSDEALATHITSELHKHLSSVIITKCDCDFHENNLIVNTYPQCSSKVDRAAVFRGQIQSTSPLQTKLIFCSLLRWQQRSPLVRIDDNLRAVDGTCPLKASSVVDSEECVTAEDNITGSRSGIPTVGVIVAGLIGGLLLIILMEIVVCCIYKVCKNVRKKTKSCEPIPIKSRYCSVIQNTVL